MEVHKGPRGVVPGIDTLRHLAGTSGGLRVSGEIVEELLVCGSKQALACGAEAGFCRRSGLLRNLAARQERFEINAVELFAAIENQNLRHAAMPAYAFTQDHHA